MIGQLEHYPIDKSVTHLFSRVENLAFERQHTSVRPAHLVRCAADNRAFGHALLGPACSDETMREMARRADAALESDVLHKRVSTELALHEEVRKVLRAALLEAQQWGAATVSVDHLVLALLHAHDFCNRFLPLDERQWRQSDAEARERLKTRRATVITHTPTLDLHSCDLTRQVRRGELAWPVCGRKTELMLLQRVLLRRTKRNPLLVGPAGAGKTTLLLGLAAALLEHPVFGHCRVCELDLASLIAGTMYRGELEARIRRILKELHDNPSVLLGIDEVHLLQSGGSESSASCAEFFKPALARGELCVIGATCPEHLGMLFRDSAMERRFEPVFIEPLDRAAVRQVLSCVRKSLSGHYELTLGVQVEVPDDVLDEIPALAALTMPERAEPDASVTLLQDAMTAALLPGDDNADSRPGQQVLVSQSTLEEVAAFQRGAAKRLAEAIQNEWKKTNNGGNGHKSVRAGVAPRQPQNG